MKKTLLYNTQTDEAGPMRYGPYLVDGQPGPLPDHIVELTVVTHDMPEVQENQIAEPAININLETKTYNEIWSVRNLTEHEIVALNPVPEEVAAWRLRAVMKKHGYEAAIAEFFASLPSDLASTAEEAWYRGTTIRRDSSSVAAFGGAVGLSSEDLDGFFKEAAEIFV